MFTRTLLVVSCTFVFHVSIAGVARGQSVPGHVFVADLPGKTDPIRI